MYKTRHNRTTFGSCAVEKVHAVVARSTFASQHAQKSALRCGSKHNETATGTSRSDTFGSWQVEKVHAVVARSTFGSQNAPKQHHMSDHFWKLTCPKIARRCCAKHISKSKCLKHRMFGPLFKVQMWFSMAGARDYAPCQNWAKKKVKILQQFQLQPLHYTTLLYTTTTTTTTATATTTLQLQQLQLQLHYTTTTTTATTSQLFKTLR